MTTSDTSSGTTRIPGGEEKAGRTDCGQEKRARIFRSTFRGRDRGRIWLVGWTQMFPPAWSGRSRTDESLEVLLVQAKDKGRLCLLPWVENGREIPPNEMPDAKCAQAIARQSVRLPPELCKPWVIDKTIEELERLNIERLSEWQKSHWLKGALALILDDKYSARLCGYRLTYDQEYGLIYEKEDRADD